MSLPGNQLSEIWENSFLKMRNVISWQLLEQGKGSMWDFDFPTQVYIKLNLLMVIFEACHFMQYLKDKMFNIKSEGIATR